MSNSELLADGPLLLALLLNNNNNNQANAPAQPNGQTPPADTTAVLSPAIVLEYVNPSLAHGPFERLETQGSAVTALSSSLSSPQLQSWSDNGYLIIANALRERQTASMLDELSSVLNAVTDESNPARKAHLIAAPAQELNPNGRVIITLAGEAVKRIGTGVHRILPVFRSIVFSSINKAIARQLGLVDPRVVQSQVIYKPVNGSKVHAHQDGMSSYTDPPSCISFWYALEDANEDNGCLQIAPGSHKTPLLKRCKVEDGRPVVYDLPISDDKKPSEEPQKMQALPVTAGTLIVMHGNLLHASNVNKSKQSRIAFSFTVVEGSLSWPEDAYLQPYEGWTEFERLEEKRL